MGLVKTAPDVLCTSLCTRQSVEVDTSNLGLVLGERDQVRPGRQTKSLSDHEDPQAALEVEEGDRTDTCVFIHDTMTRPPTGGRT